MITIFICTHAGCKKYLGLRESDSHTLERRHYVIQARTEVEGFQRKESYAEERILMLNKLYTVLAQSVQKTQ